MTPTLLFLFQAQQPPSFGSFIFIQLGLIVAIGYFFLIRPSRQREKEHRERIQQLRKGDEIITAGGIVGKVVHLTDERLTIKSDESRLVILRSRVADIVSDKPKDER